MTTLGAITLPQHIYAEIIAHAQAGAPQEVCGILSGRDGLATELVRARNEAANPISEYWMDGQTLLRQFDFEERGEAMIAIYHSHPATEAYPSAVDAANAFYPDAVYLICSLAQPQRPSIRGWRLIQEKLAQQPAALQAVRSHPPLWARRYSGPQEDAYELATVEADGRQRWLRVRVVEVQVLGCGQTSEVAAV